MAMFERLGIPHTVFVEPQEASEYAKALSGFSSLHVLPHSNKGLTVTRNYIWRYAENAGHRWFWTFDDNIRAVYRFNRNLKTPCDGAALQAAEDFITRYENMAIGGLNYFMFVKRKYLVPPVVFNTRVYSNMLIRADLRDASRAPIRNRLYFNDDTDLCLQALKAGWCTVLFNAFLIEKKTTMTTPGGLTEEYKATDERREFAEELAQAHPDVVKVTRKWGRWHHHVDYSGFKQRPRALRAIPRRVNNYGMQLQVRGNDGMWRETAESPT
jgi:hypothetical protein